MLSTHPTQPGLLFASFLFRTDLHKESDLKKLWEDQYGSSQFFHPSQNPLIDYYAKEMGEGLGRFLAVTENRFPRSELLQSKLLSLRWENDFAVEARRMVNIDTGLLSLENFLLATTKNYSHRIFIGNDLFADLTFEFKNGKFQTLPWTYPDYLDPEKMEFLTSARKRLLASFLPTSKSP